VSEAVVSVAVISETVISEWLRRAASGGGSKWASAAEMNE